VERWLNWLVRRDAPLDWDEALVAAVRLATQDEDPVAEGRRVEWDGEVLPLPP
jgi:hypothetical protein